MATAIYRRVSSKEQSTASQAPDLDAYTRSLRDKGEEVLEPFEDKFTGKTMKRPGWDKLWTEVLTGRVSRVVVWRMDRLGRTCVGLAHLFRDLLDRKVDLVSLREGFNLRTPAGKLQAHILASVAEYETEVRQERQLAGIAVARQEVKDGKRQSYGSGRKPGITILLSVCEHIVRLKAEGKNVTEIATLTNLSRPTIYRVLRESEGK